MAFIHEQENDIVNIYKKMFTIKMPTHTILQEFFLSLLRIYLLHLVFHAIFIMNMDYLINIQNMPQLPLFLRGSPKNRNFKEIQLLFFKNTEFMHNSARKSAALFLLEFYQIFVNLSTTQFTIGPIQSCFLPL